MIKHIRCLLLLVVIVGGFATVIGTGNDEEEKQCVSYEATGNYIYDSATKKIAIDVVEDDFPGDVGIEGEFSVPSISETSMTWIDGEGAQLVWNRESGNNGEIFGFWKRKIDDVTYTLTLNAANTFTLNGGACF